MASSPSLKAALAEKLREREEAIVFKDYGVAHEKLTNLAAMSNARSALNNCFSASQALLEELDEPFLQAHGYAEARLRTLVFNDGSPHHAVALTREHDGQRFIVDYTARQYGKDEEAAQAIDWPLVLEEQAWQDYIAAQAYSRWELTLPEQEKTWTTAKAVQAGLRSRFPQVDIGFTERSGGYKVLDRIVVKDRAKGTGTAVLEELTRLADERNWALALTPSADFGASSKARLERFYRRFCFVPNRGRAKDFTTTEAMVRQPKP